MKVKYITLASGPDGAIYPGQLLEVEDTKGKQLVSGGYAELVEETKEEAKEEVKPHKKK